jgi:chromosome segregation ATPase
MDASTLLSFIKDYAGLLIGLVFLLAAVSVLPGRAKWYVLTAGLAILGYEAYLRTRNRKLLAEADKEREGLRKRAEELDRRSADLAKTVADLNQQLAENRTRLAALNTEAAELAQRGGDISKRKAQLDEESERRSQENEALLQQMGGHEDLLSALRDAQHAIEQLDRTVQ